MNPATCSRSRASGRDHLIAVAGELARGRGSEPAGSRAPRSSRAGPGWTRSMISASSSPRAANPAPRSLRISRNRSGYGSFMMLLTRSRSIALPLRSSGSRCWPAPGSPSGISRARAAAGVPGARGSVGVALDELLADQRLRADQAGRVVAEVLEGRVVDLQARSPPCPASGSPSSRAASSLVGDVDRGDRADVGAGDADLLAVDQEAGVVEDRADLVAALVAAGAACRSQAPPRRPRARRTMTSARLMAPGARRRVRTRRRARRRRGTGGRSDSASRRSAASSRPGSELRPEAERGEGVELLAERDRLEGAGCVVVEKTLPPAGCART